MSDDKIKARMLKLLALARQGVGGEAQNAHAFLQKMLDKHGMTMADLEDSEQPKTRVNFKWTDPLHKRLLIAVICKVLNRNEFSHWRRPRERSSFRVELTAAQHVEVDLMMAAYWPALQRQTDLMLAAFTHKNNLYPDVESKEPENPPSEEDIETILAMVRSMRATPVHKAIGHGAAA